MRTPTIAASKANAAADVERRLADLERVIARLLAVRPAPATRSHVIQVSQASHGLAVGDHIRPTASGWVKSQADTAANAVVGGTVVSVQSPGLFTYATPGSYIAGLSGLTANAVHYLSSATAGARVTTAPPIAVPVLLADSTTSGVLMTAWSGGGAIHSAAADPSAGDDSGDGYVVGTIWINTTSDAVFIAADVTVDAAVWVPIPSGSGTAPTEDGTVFASDSGGTAGEWTRDLDLGRNATGKAGKLRILSPNASGVAVEIDGALVTASSKKLTVREIDICDGGTAKKMLVIGCAPY